MGFLDIREVTKSYGPVEVLHRVDISVAEGEFLVLVGPSGCGKSTLLNMIAGLEGITSGDIAIKGRVVNGVHPSKRNIAMVFQSYALYPNMTVAQNITFGLEMHGVARPERERALADVAKLLQIDHLIDRKPGQLSGGQRQRVAMGRALVRKPDVFLFDEPLSNLDAKLRVQMRVELEALHRELGATMIYVTHDQVEAMTMADKIVVLNGGRIEQVGAPLDLYHRPATEFVAGFIGAPAMNFLDVAARDASSVAYAGHAISAPPGAAGAARIGIRPEHVVIRPVGEGNIDLDVTLRETLGGDAYLYARTEAGDTLVIRAEGDTVLDAGARIGADLPAARLHFFAADGRTLASGGVAA